VLINPNQRNQSCYKQSCDPPTLVIQEETIWQSAKKFPHEQAIYSWFWFTGICLAVAFSRAGIIDKSVSALSAIVKAQAEACAMEGFRQYNNSA
jgi:hypothetical protein